MRQKLLRKTILLITTMAVPNMSNDNEISNLLINLGLDCCQIRGQGGIDVKFNLTNKSNKTLNVLKWQLPIYGIGNNDLF